ncbi:MAG TPA: 1,4-dihydroxy-2-naphthoate polyprenyltransferase [Acidimicrobiia bacterium]|nr:1,4-dihydroxy-2-naphthoate polyprenyltransferase [Acidimicrobiia bacterium]
MTTTVPVRVRDWVAGARPRTLGAGIAPVVVGTAVGAAGQDVLIGRALLALVVAVAIQVGANYANDYSDGVRGTDADRVGPRRLTASGAASPAAVRRAAAIAFGVAATAGLALSIVVDPWLLLVGAAALVAAVLYTGGPKPYGYLGLGELSVVVFFGFAATAGSAYVQHGSVTAAAWWASAVCGLLAAAVLAVNNARDRVGDAAAGKRTLAVRLGDRGARALCVALVAGAFGAVAALGTIDVGAFLGLAALPLAVPPLRAVLGGRTGPGLVPALVGLVRLEVVVAALIAVGILAW